MKIHSLPAVALASALVTVSVSSGMPRASASGAQRVDSLIDPSPFEARVVRDVDSGEIHLENGLVRRTWRLAPNAACVAFDDLVEGRSMLRSVRPEARVTIDGVALSVGGLVGQPNHAFLTEQWLDAMTAEEGALRFVGLEAGEPEERLGWGRRRHASPGAVWPPKGVSLRMDYELSPMGIPSMRALASGEKAVDLPRAVEIATGEPLFQTTFANLDGWRVHASGSHPRSSFGNEGKPGEIYTPQNTAVFAERALPAETASVEVALELGTDRTKSWGPGIALVFDERTVKLNVRGAGESAQGEPVLGLWDGEREVPGLAGRAGVAIDGEIRLRLRIEGDQVHCDARMGDGEWLKFGAVDLRPGETPRSVRIGKLDLQGGARDFPEPGELVRCRVTGFAVRGPAAEPDDADLRARMEALMGLRVSVHYELYDGIPAMSKRITVHNGGEAPVTVDRFTAEELGVVEASNPVEVREGIAIEPPSVLHVETDFAFGGFTDENANRHVVHWRADPLYSTQVNYLRQTPCLLVVEPNNGPAQAIQPGGRFDSFRVFELVTGEADRERKGLLQRQMYRTLSPWVTENPITHHLLSNDPERVLEAIDQAAEVGFEAVILSFGSGFNMESRDPGHLATWKRVADHAESRGIELGCYSLFSSRFVGAENMIVSPEGVRPTHGQCPAVTSPWGQEWLRTIRDFYAATGFEQFENDGPYPGDVDTTARPPLQAGAEDSRWVQGQMTNELYRDLRADGVYINAPDYYFLSGSNKCGMGYREVNWSLPRAHQVIHTRQNIFDGTWTRTPSMGWMFVPLAEYQGGGAAATIEPLDEHLDHYRRMMRSNFGMGVQAHYRGPRLFDTDRTREAVAAEVAWFKAHRDILESDIVHGRRADGRHLDWVLHVNPALEERGMLCVWNPLPRPVTQMLTVDLYYTGIESRARFRGAGGEESVRDVARDYTVDVEVTVPAGGMSWYSIR